MGWDGLRGGGWGVCGGYGVEGVLDREGVVGVWVGCGLDIVGGVYGGGVV